MIAAKSPALWKPLVSPLTQWFRRNPDKAAPQSPAQRPPAQPVINLIAAQRSQAIVELSVTEGLFQSAILAVDTEAGLIHIDEWFPRGHRARPGQAVTVSLRLGNRREQFSTDIAGCELVDGIERYHLRLPPSVGYEQRRNAYRQSLRPGQARCAFVAAHFRHSAGLRDISSLGMRLELREWRPLPIDTLLEDLEFELLGEHFHCAAIVRNTRDSSDGGTEIGAAFVDLPRDRQRDLERLIMRMQRRELQRSLTQPHAKATIGLR